MASFASNAIGIASSGDSVIRSEVTLSLTRFDASANEPRSASPIASSNVGMDNLLATVGALVEQFVHFREQVETALALEQRVPRLHRDGRTRLHRQKTRHYLKSVLDPMVRVPDRRVLERQVLPDAALGGFGILTTAALVREVLSAGLLHDFVRLEQREQLERQDQLNRQLLHDAHVIDAEAGGLIVVGDPKSAKLSPCGVVQRHDQGFCDRGLGRPQRREYAFRSRYENRGARIETQATGTEIPWYRPALDAGQRPADGIPVESQLTGAAGSQDAEPRRSGVAQPHRYRKKSPDRGVRIAGKNLRKLAKCGDLALQVCDPFRASKQCIGR